MKLFDVIKIYVDVKFQVEVFCFLDYFFIYGELWDLLEWVVFGI